MTLTSRALRDASDPKDAARVDQVLSGVGRKIRRAMLDAIPDAEPHKWLYELVRAYPGRPGKAIRPSLCLATCRAFGGSDDDAFPVAVAIEMLHNAFLVHDDIADGSERRRGRPTLPAHYGQALSLNAGDAMVVLANQILRHHARSLDPGLADQVLEEFDMMAFRTLEGQATELGWRRDRVTDLSPEDYLDLILHKTCWYTTIHPLRVGAMLGGAEPANVHAMVRFGFYLGAAFQIRDDLLNLTGDEEVYGKEINGDLYEAKRSLALIHLGTEVRGEDAVVLSDYLSVDRPERTVAMIESVRVLFDKYGSIEFAREYAEGIAAAAVTAYEEAFAGCAEGEDAQFVRALIPYMLGRAA
ncbi:MAG TPA: polyprenyl synthetase family protein [Acidimicrobiales bacterium]|nr:polyprenyl synthetase family protein [Acidimicrobiales bacterium]